MNSGESLVAAVTRVAGLPYGLARSEAAALLVRRAEEEGGDVLPYALAGLVDALFWGGETDKAVVPFSRLSRLWDSRPDLFDDVDTSLYFGAFAWMLGGLQDDPTVPSSTIETLLADMELRYRVAGRSLSAPAYERLRWTVRQELGREATDAAYTSWLQEPDDAADRCEHCRRTRRGIYLSRDGRWEEVVAVLTAPGLPERGCATEPADLLSVLALAQLELGDAEAAVQTHRAAVAALRRSETDMVGARGRGIALLGRGGAAAAALAALTEDQHLLHGAITPYWHLQFLVSVAAATGAIAAVDPGREVHLRDVPATTVAELDAWVRARALANADAFGARAGSTRTRERALALMDAPPTVRIDEAFGRAAAGLVGDRAGSGAEDDDANDTATADIDTATTATAVLARAERQAAAGDPAPAVVSYLAAARLAASAGASQGAGFALAEAARLEDGLGDVAGAHAHYGEAVALLRSGGVSASDLAPVLVAWAEVATGVGDVVDLLAALEPALAELGLGVDRAGADLLDAHARVLATSAVGEDRAATVARAAQDAVAAGEAFAGHGAVADAGHAFWLAGRLREELGETEAAVWGLESAVEAFTISGSARARAEATGELVALLRADGQDERAGTVLARLAGGAQATGSGS